MKFDNAFLTKSGNIGLQFKDKGELLTIYKDGKGKLIVSEHATIQQNGILVVKYGQMAHRYEKKEIQHA